MKRFLWLWAFLLFSTFGFSIVISQGGAPLDYRTSSYPGFDIQRPYMNEHPAYASGGHRLCGPVNTRAITNEMYQREMQQYYHEQRLKENADRIKRSF